MSYFPLSFFLFALMSPRRRMSTPTPTPSPSPPPAIFTVGPPGRRKRIVVRTTDATSQIPSVVETSTIQPPIVVPVPLSAAQMQKALFPWLKPGETPESVSIHSLSLVIILISTFQSEVHRVSGVPSSLADLIPAISTLANPLPSSPVVDAATPSEAALVSNNDQLISSLAQPIPFFSPSPPRSLNSPIFVPVRTPDDVPPLPDVEDLLKGLSSQSRPPRVVLRKCLILF